MPETEEGTSRVEHNTLNNGNGVGGGNTKNRFAALADLEKMAEVINSRDDDGMDEGGEDMHNEETHKLQSKVHEDGGNLDGRLENNLLPNIESIPKQSHSSTNSSLRAPIETRGRKGKSKVINDGTTWKNKKARGHSSIKNVRHD